VQADASLNTLWRNADDGRGVLLQLRPAGLEAVGIEANSAAAAGARAEGGAMAADIPAAASVAATAPDAAPVPRTRDGTKQAALVAMLRRKEGATIAQIVEATGWQPHTVRGAFAGALKKRLGLTVTSEKVEGRGRVYRSQR
jgi:hypothetical protein